MQLYLAGFFLRRIIDLLCTFGSRYKIEISREAKKDLECWLIFFKFYNGKSFFRALGIIDGKSFNFGSDASKLGFGATFRSKWIQHRYPGHWIKYGITILELFPIYVLIDMFGKHLCNSTVVIYCDNAAVCDIINYNTSKNKRAMVIVRKLFLVLIAYNIHLKARHIAGKLNCICDKLSRFQVGEKWLREKGLDDKKQDIPAHLWPENFKW